MPYHDRHRSLQSFTTTPTATRPGQLSPAHRVHLKKGLRRPGDLLGRYGGEEFVCLLPETTLDRAVERADELGRAIMELNIVHAHAADEDVVTISRGVSATIPTGELELADLLQVVDAMLYETKRSGRNRTMACPLGPADGQDTPPKM